MVYHLSNPLIAPVSMDYQKSLQKPKLGNGEVTSHYSLQKVISYELHCKNKDKYILLKEKRHAHFLSYQVQSRISINHEIV